MLLVIVYSTCFFYNICITLVFKYYGLKVHARYINLLNSLTFLDIKYILYIVLKKIPSKNAVNKRRNLILPLMFLYILLQLVTSQGVQFATEVLAVNANLDYFLTVLHSVPVRIYFNIVMYNDQ